MQLCVRDFPYLQIQARHASQQHKTTPKQISIITNSRYIEIDV